MRIGILGGGQLALMLTESATKLGHECFAFDSKEDACGGRLAKLTVGTLDDLDSVKEFASTVDVLTYESENIPVDTLKSIEGICPFFPPILALETTQDRLLEKNLCNSVGIPTAKFADIQSKDDLNAALKNLGLPCILKTRKDGYDGKGQVFIATKDDIQEAEKLATTQPCIVEKCVDFDFEVSIIASRSQSCPIEVYPLTKNIHKEGILHLSYSPVDIEDHIEQKAHHIAQTLLLEFNYVGTMAIELFITKDGKVLVNEIAPRVHNSGHWTIEGTTASQFENHIRALTDMPLKTPETQGYSAMINIIGIVPEGIENFSDPEISLHLYGKSERPKRKIGHITIVTDSKEKTQSKTDAILQEYF